jgi:hypothetical protein
MRIMTAGHTPTHGTLGGEGGSPATMACRHYSNISTIYCIIYIRKQDYSIFNPVPPAFITHFSNWGNSFRALLAIAEILNKFVGTLGKCL